MADTAAQSARPLGALVGLGDPLVDADLAGAVEAEGVRCVVAPTVMSSVDRSAALSRRVLDAVA